MIEAIDLPPRPHAGGGRGRLRHRDRSGRLAGARGRHPVPRGAPHHRRGGEAGREPGAALAQLPLEALQAIDARIDERVYRRAVGRGVGRGAGRAMAAPRRTQVRAAHRRSAHRASASMMARIRRVLAPRSCCVRRCSRPEAGQESLSRRRRALGHAADRPADSPTQPSCSSPIRQAAARTQSDELLPPVEERRRRPLRPAAPLKAKPWIISLYRDGVLYAEDVPLTLIAGSGRHAGLCLFARHDRAPFRVCSARRWRSCRSRHSPIAVKANPNLAVLADPRTGEGYGADVVSGGELKRALAAGMRAGEDRLLRRRQDARTRWRRALEARASASSTSNPRKKAARC